MSVNSGIECDDTEYCEMEKIDVFKFYDWLGKYSFFHLLVFTIVSFICINGAWNLMSSVFIGYTPEFYHCKLPGTPHNSNTENDTLSSSIPLNPDGTYSHCRKYRSFSKNTTEPCGSGGWTYIAPYKPTITTKYDAVCDQAYLLKLADTSYMVGAIVVGVLVMPLADWFGRKWIIIVLLLMQCALNFGTIFIPSLKSYIAIRFFFGMTNRMSSNLAFIYLNECFSRSQRASANIIVVSLWSVGMLSLVLVSYITPNWVYFQICLGVFGLIPIAFIWVMPESIVWLIANNKFHLATESMLKAARKTSVPFSEFHSDDLVRENIRKHTHLDLFRTPRMCRYMFILMFMWMVTAVVYFGITFSIGDFKGNFYLNMTLNAIVEIPAYILAIILTSRLGGRKAMAILYFISAISNILASVMVPMIVTGASIEKIALVSTIAGKFGITATYSIIGLLSSEVMPTHVRSISDGVLKVAEGIGGVLATAIITAAQTKPNLQVVTRSCFGILAMLAGILVLFLPDMHKKSLPETIQEIEKI